MSEPTRRQILNFLDKKIERLQPEVDVYKDQKLRNQHSPRWLLRLGKKASEEHELLMAIRRLIEHGSSKPISREFVERWVSQIIFLPLNVMEHWSVCLPEQLRDMLRELGHEVEEKEER